MLEKNSCLTPKSQHSTSSGTLDRLLPDLLLWKKEVSSRKFHTSHSTNNHHEWREGSTSFTSRKNQQEQPQGYLCIGEGKSGYGWISTSKTGRIYERGDLQRHLRFQDWWCSVQCEGDKSSPYAEDTWRTLLKMLETRDKLMKYLFNKKQKPVNDDSIFRMNSLLLMIMFFSLYFKMTTCYENLGKGEEAKTIPKARINL